MFNLQSFVPLSILSLILVSSSVLADKIEDLGDKLILEEKRNVRLDKTFNVDLQQVTKTYQGKTFIKGAVPGDGNCSLYTLKVLFPEKKITRSNFVKQLANRINQEDEEVKETLAYELYYQLLNAYGTNEPSEFTGSYNQLKNQLEPIFEKIMRNSTAFERTEEGEKSVKQDIVELVKNIMQDKTVMQDILKSLADPTRMLSLPPEPDQLGTFGLACKLFKLNVDIYMSKKNSDEISLLNNAFRFGGSEPTQSLLYSRIHFEPLANLEDIETRRNMANTILYMMKEHLGVYKNVDEAIMDQELSSLCLLEEGHQVKIKTSKIIPSPRDIRGKKVEFELTPVQGSFKSRGEAQDILFENKTIRVTTKEDTMSYALMTNKLDVSPDEKIQIPYEITVEAGGRLSLGLLNTKTTGWYGQQLFLEAGEKAKTFIGIYERVVPQGEKEASLVFRNAQQNAAQTIFTIRKLDILKEETRPSSAVVVEPKLKIEPNTNTSPSIKDTPAAQKNILQPKEEFILSELDPTFGSGRAKGMAEKIEKIGNAIKITTKKDTGSYELESKRFLVNAGQTIKVPYEITVNAGGRMSLGLLRSDTKGWYGQQLFLEAEENAKTFKGVYERMVPQDEKEASLVFRNAQKNPAQTIFTVHKIEILKEKIVPQVVSTQK